MRVQDQVVTSPGPYPSTADAGLSWVLGILLAATVVITIWFAASRSETDSALADVSSCFVEWLVSSLSGPASCSSFALRSTFNSRSAMNHQCRSKPSGW